MLRDWRRIALQVSTQGKVRTEVAWFNFAPGRMHWADHAGRDRTDRQRIKRKAARWAEGYRKMPLGKRLAVVPAITDPPFFGAGPSGEPGREPFCSGPPRQGFLSMSVGRSCREPAAGAISPSERRQPGGSQSRRRGPQG